MPTQPTPEVREDYNALLELLIPFAEQGRTQPKSDYDQVRLLRAGEPG